MEKLKSGVHLNPGSEEEVEIRGCSVWAVEVLIIITIILHRSYIGRPEMFGFIYQE